MSTGPRLPLHKADAVAKALFELWKLDPRTSFVVGSVRRRKADVGDLELVVPAEHKAFDVIHERIASTLQRDVAGQLFVSPPTPTAEPIGRAIKGFKPGFLSCSLVVKPWDHEIPVQIYRYTPANLGWILIMRTGPAEFGKYFLEQWKKHWRTPEGKPASQDGHLVNALGTVIPVPTEEEAFRLCGMPKYIEPERRENVMVSINRSRSMAAS